MGIHTAIEIGIVFVIAVFVCGVWFYIKVS